MFSMSLPEQWGVQLTETCIFVSVCFSLFPLDRMWSGFWCCMVYSYCFWVIELFYSLIGGTSINIQLSPNKALRAAMLKSRFADTIFKATHQALVDHVIVMPFALSNFLTCMLWQFCNYDRLTGTYRLYLLLMMDCYLGWEAWFFKNAARKRKTGKGTTRRSV